MFLGMALASIIVSFLSESGMIKGVVPRFFQISIFVINTLMMGISNKIKNIFF